ncbi:putative peptidyl-prolyl cis-trans isomerase [Candidatus Nitrospira inopinata]|uniref:Peptidyl-prolyl cis-trans isomerase n=2 Tax=Candidatus Nitrospira inopinata TaxID=1715989 RepID=A0A0S4KPY5_9BACT|nr:putative peptidyl-prolyl cis-trans isomerase [Candidatus Nitrospira inopinata]
MLMRRAALTICATVLTGCALSLMAPAGVVAADKSASQKDGASKGPRAIIKTKFGDMEIKFFPEAAPRHVENFIALAKAGFYNGTIFHRVIPGFMIQGGDPNTKDSLKKELYGMGGPTDEKGNPVRLKAEFNDISHKRGIVSMARSQDPDSAGSQFFIVVEDSPFLDNKYTVFGEVVKGIGVADKIVNVPRDAQDNPKERVEMTVTIAD